MRRLLLLTLLALGCTDPTVPDSADGTYRLHSVVYENRWTRQACPCRGNYEMRLSRGELRGSGALAITNTPKVGDDPASVVPAFVPATGHYQAAGNVLHLYTFPVIWTEGTYRIDGDSLIRSVVSDAYVLEVVWVRK